MNMLRVLLDGLAGGADHCEQQKLCSQETPSSKSASCQLPMSILLVKFQGA
jgi:hypothetical protein